MAFLWLFVGILLGAGGVYYLIKIHPKIKQVYRDGVPK